MSWKKVLRWLGRDATSGSTSRLSVPQPAQASVPRRTSRKKAAAVIGLDFGTSCSKVVVRLPYADGLAHAIRLAESSSPFLLRSMLDGCANGLDPMSNLKVRLMIEPGSLEARASAATYLAAVLRKARASFLELSKKNYPQYEFEWSMNVGVPSSGFKEPAGARPTTAELREGFLAAGRAAWTLSQGPEVPSREAAATALAASTGDVPVYVIPEIVAAAEGYRRSASARPGVHVLVDVGATTLDICAFILGPAGASSPFGCAVPVVASLGTAMLHGARLRSLDGRTPQGQACAIDPRDPDCVVPDSLSDYVALGTPVPLSLSSADREFLDDCELALRHAVGGMYQVNWKADYDSVPLFLTGGGGRMRSYVQAVERVREKDSVKWHDLQPRPLERPDDLRPESLDAATASRLMVAYGLSYPRVDFGEDVGDGGFRGFTDPATIPDIPPAPRPKLEARYVSKDQV